MSLFGALVLLMVAPGLAGVPGNARMQTLQKNVEKAMMELYMANANGQIDEKLALLAGKPKVKKGPVMPFGQLESFGREDTASELTDASIKESNAMIDQIEQAVVSETKRSMFRALTRLRGATIANYDGMANAQAANIDQYTKKKAWTSSHELNHLATQEGNVEEWAFPNTALVAKKKADKKKDGKHKEVKKEEKKKDGKKAEKKKNGKHKEVKKETVKAEDEKDAAKKAALLQTQTSPDVAQQVAIEGRENLQIHDVFAENEKESEKTQMEVKANKDLSALLQIKTSPDVAQQVAIEGRENLQIHDVFAENEKESEKTEMEVKANKDLSALQVSLLQIKTSPDVAEQVAIEGRENLQIHDVFAEKEKESAKTEMEVKANKDLSALQIGVKQPASNFLHRQAVSQKAGAQVAVRVKNMKDVKEEQAAELREEEDFEQGLDAKEDVDFKKWFSDNQQFEDSAVDEAKLAFHAEQPKYR